MKTGPTRNERYLAVERLAELHAEWNALQSQLAAVGSEMDTTERGLRVMREGPCGVIAIA
jgi:hypothetical protein